MGRRVCGADELEVDVRHTTASVDELLRDGLELARSYADVIVVAPEFDILDSLTVEPGLIAIAMDYGYLRAADVTNKADRQQQELTRRIIRARSAQWATDRDARAAAQSNTLPVLLGPTFTATALERAGDTTDGVPSLRHLVAAKPRASVPPTLRS